ncbi:prepilin peptidase [Roseibacterium sp. SDUM158016]|jgi:prepilin peptidase CpaA|uniref:prepilin peptidase n=1 Tax=Roseicyclus sediminis TaxID=2980997 RepID=UPI0021D0DF8B|nr:prepilin peptidase [Roseibacterium sp. SDUM158016]MCU4655192.1 prepilin peptidase [Roseibacterium sp. SDUM158016]
MTLSLTFMQALWFLPLALPICVWVALTDLREMRIPNVAVLALFAVFVGAGLMVLPLNEFGFRLLQLVVVLIAGFIITSLGMAGAGDSKFAAAMAPFIAPGDYLFFLMLFSLVLLGSWITHRSAGRVPALRRATAEWASWESGKLFPMGVALAGALVIYLAMGLSAGL